jgi:hypothetical protein
LLDSNGLHGVNPEWIFSYLKNDVRHFIERSLNDSVALGLVGHVHNLFDLE